MKRSAVLMSLSLLVTPAMANVSDDVTQLIAQVEQSECTFIRNGKRHTQQEAADHLRRKWGYAEDDVTDIQVFISEVASKSWFTGTPYTVDCQGKKLTSEEWLTQLWQQASNN